MAVPEIFETIENSGLSTWLRESNSVFGFYFVLLFHTFGLALLVGANTVVDLRILGVAHDLPLVSLKRLFTVMWAGFAINATTGLLLIIAYPTKEFTNPVFYLKLLFIATAMVVLQKINTRVFDETDLSEAVRIARGKTLAMLSLALWFGAITTGRLLAYTANYLTYGSRT